MRGVDNCLLRCRGLRSPLLEHVERRGYLGPGYTILGPRRPHKPGYRARFGISARHGWVAPGARFCREMFSEYYASGIVKQVWETARRLGYGDYFVDEKGGYVTDDHVYVNRYGIPQCRHHRLLSRETVTGFPPYWHTVDDTMKNIDPATLKAVGQTVLTVIYEE